ncbi:MAG: ABC transporter permease [Chloroflexota bacterium]
MSNISTIALKEIRTYFASPMAYVVAAAFLAITGFFFVASVSDVFSEASIRGYIAGAIFFMVFLAPALTMRLLAEEQKLGTLEILMTSPVREWEIVLGKFIAALVMMLLMIAGTLYFLILLLWYGNPDIGPVFTGYLGLLLYGCATLSVGLMASALSSNQLVSLVVGAGILTGLTVIDFVSERLTGVAAEAVAYLQLGSSFSVFDQSTFGVVEGGHFADFARGILSVGDIVYYLSITAVFLLVTVMLLEARRWR